MATPCCGTSGCPATYNGRKGSLAGPMKANITLKLDADLIRELRVMATSRGTSVSSLLTAVLEGMVRETKLYGSARQRALARMKQGFDLRWTPPRSRDELHNR
jgi:hypothetical protein